MCGRFSLHVPPTEYSRRIAIDYGLNIQQNSSSTWNQSYNVSPTSNVPVINQSLVVRVCRWGVIPHFSKESQLHGSNYTASLKTINARSESLEDGSSPLWNSLKSSKRCIIPVDGFFEWLQSGREKIPHFTKRKDGKMMMFAGLYDTKNSKNGNEQNIQSFTIITTRASSQFSSVHSRMPVILTQQGAVKWLDKSKKWDTELARLLEPFNDDLDIYAVTKEMSKPGSSKPSYVQPINQRKDGIKSFFAKQSQSPQKDGVTKEDLKKEESGDVRKEETESNLKREDKELNTAIKRSLEDAGGDSRKNYKPLKIAKKEQDNKTLDGFVKQG
ncbi:hypothetical protein E3P92_00524 [Wallemia ichthyophaga]|uniref:DUF159-domain-containing protein n=2 Tax=Wallemia ichthyophaga TaxID=245174 RepID=A0A4T0H7X2_WALIC|nr:UPF0361 protein yoqW [Wallemia ichthyophaga EXF-994]TIA70553.1 hypothetical protein E3P91_03051 [Wallemia ichthyophaga]EOR01532.1 UPF0361 protein yoqW [Wallemia ichthyophaga EXF-994]TIB08748.1 hypothetical protein E3P90_03563 [Wallemia ichthyophaga]TIB10227.1 hypothetical protein E3P93_02976 [Wallemia ichthyophaga]TIB18763.1 hypothetical protein E3P92_00524 [Wallemia ichthyophaga]